MDKEQNNLLGYCRNPVFFIKTSFFILTRIKARLIRTFATPTFYYPTAIKKLLNSLKPRKIEVVEKNFATIVQVKVSLKLRLATGFFEFRDHTSWAYKFKDPEQALSLHRFGYLLLAVTSYSDLEIKVVGLSLVRNWCSLFLQDKQGILWEPYTAAERLCNVILFIAFVENNGITSIPEVPADIASYLMEHAYFILAHLEYSEECATGNHVINNARALYIAGISLKNEVFIQASKLILFDFLDKAIDQHGFLREGSSHYQFLITRWLLEVMWFAEIGKDEQLRLFLGSRLKQMLQCCWFFLVLDEERQEWTIPLIGDVSPDFPWTWLMNL